MQREPLVERLFEALIVGDRPAARTLIQDQFERGASAQNVVIDLLWPMHEYIEKLHRSDQLSRMAYHLSTRLLRSLVERVGERLPSESSKGQAVFCVCGRTEGEELGAQMAVDLLESRGYRVAFAGGGVPGDEIMAQVHEARPDVLLMFASAASDLPDIRSVIDRLKEIGACPDLRIVVGGGVFNRAEGLAEEIGVELYAVDPLDLVDLLTEEQPMRAMIEERPLAKITKKRRKAA